MWLLSSATLKKSYDSFRKEILVLCVCVCHHTHHVGSENQTQIVWFGGKYLHPLTILPASVVSLSPSFLISKVGSVC